MRGTLSVCVCGEGGGGFKELPRSPVKLTSSQTRSISPRACVEKWSVTVVVRLSRSVGKSQSHCHSEVALQRTAAGKP